MLDNLSLFYSSTKIPVYIYDTQYNPIVKYPNTDIIYPKDILKRCDVAMTYANVDLHTPFIYSSNSCYFAWIKCDETSSVLIGPISPFSVNYREFYTSNKIYYNSEEILQLYYLTQQSAHIPLIQFVHSVTLFIKLVFGKDIDAEYIIKKYLITYNVPSIPVHTKSFEPHYITLEEILAFQNKIIYYLCIGNLENIIDAYNSTPLFASLPQMISATTDYHKFFFMYAISCYTTVLNEGVDVHKAYPIMDTYVSQIPAITSAEVLREYCIKMTTDYCNQIIPVLKLKSASPVITKCLHYIHDNLYNKITIEDLMEHCNVSRRTITRHFSEHYSMTVSECIMNAKLKEAAFLLTDSHFSLIEISNQLAFSSQSHFTVAFKKMYNYTPLQYRNKHKK